MLKHRDCLHQLQNMIRHGWNHESTIDQSITLQRINMDNWLLELLNKRLDNFEGELKKVKENKQPDDQSKQQSSGNYENYNRGSYRGRFNTYHFSMLDPLN
jgi:hypothetical protein